MVNTRRYPAGVVPALVSLSQGTCYWPDCGEPIVRFVDGSPINNFEIAHIRAANRDGPRYVPDMTDAERNGFPNLVLLCLVHHKIVDKMRPNDFSIDTMESWKKARETAGQAVLQGLRGLTEEQLQDMITASFEDFKATFQDAIDRLEQVNAQAAALLRPLVNDLAEMRFKRTWPGEDTAEMLMYAARRLEHLPESSARLKAATEQLQGMRSVAADLLLASRRLRPDR